MFVLLTAMLYIRWNVTGLKRTWPFVRIIRSQFECLETCYMGLYRMSNQAYGFQSQNGMSAHK